MKHSCYKSIGRLLLALSGLLLTTGPAAKAQAVRIIFLHHSCGHNLIEEGGVREGLAALGYEFYDHGYNNDGLRLADGSYSGTNYDVPDDNTDPDGLAAVFAQPLNDPPDNTFSYLMQYDVIAFKSCFPVSNIYSDELLTEYRSYYLSMRDRMDQHPDKLFVVVTQPPQVPGSSDAGEAARARTLANWLQSDEFLAGHPNVFTFDFFGYLAGDDNFLRPEYRYDDYDAHPNERANREIGPLFVAFIDQAIQSYGGAGPRPAPTTPGASDGEATEPPPDSAPPVTEGLVDDFESVGGWEGYADREETTVVCGAEDGPAHSGTASLHVGYAVATGGWADCVRSFEPAQNWSGGSGISLWLYADGAGRWVTLMVFAGDPDDPTPFEVNLEIPAESRAGWTQLNFPWSDFDRAEWASEGGLAELDLAQVTGYGFSMAADVHLVGDLWIDDVGLTGVTSQPTGTPPATSVEEEPGVEEPVEVETPEEPLGGLYSCPAAALPFGVAIILSVRRRR